MTTCDRRKRPIVLLFLTLGALPVAAVWLLIAFVAVALAAVLLG